MHEMDNNLYDDEGLACRLLSSSAVHTTLNDNSWRIRSTRSPSAVFIFVCFTFRSLYHPSSQRHFRPTPPEPEMAGPICRDFSSLNSRFRGSMRKTATGIEKSRQQHPFGLFCQRQIIACSEGARFRCGYLQKK